MTRKPRFWWFKNRFGVEKDVILETLWKVNFENFGFKKYVQEKPPMSCKVLRWVFSCHISIIHHSIHRYEDGEKVGDHQPGVVTTERLEGFKLGSRALSTRRGIKLFDLCSCYSNRSLEVDLRWVYECLNTARWQGNLDYGGLRTDLGSKKTSF